MKKFTIYPAIDLRNGKVVRLKQGDPARETIFSDSPATIASQWECLGASWLHLVNLDSAMEQDDILNQNAIQSILSKINQSTIKVQLGGGIRSLEMVQNLLDIGVARVILGTAAITDPDFLRSALRIYGSDRIVIAVDAQDGLLKIRGWRENSGITALPFVRNLAEIGITTIIFTDINRDGIGTGINLAATCEIAEQSGLQVIASGGVHTLEDVIAVKNSDLAGAIVGRALYDGNIHLDSLIQLQKGL